MEFIQIIELRTSKVDELRAMQREWEEEDGGQANASPFDHQP